MRSWWRMICAESVEWKWELSYIVYVIVHYSAHSGSELRRLWETKRTISKCAFSVIMVNMFRGVRNKFQIWQIGYPGAFLNLYKNLFQAKNLMWKTFISKWTGPLASAIVTSFYFIYFLFPRPLLVIVSVACVFPSIWLLLFKLLHLVAPSV